MTHPTRLEGDEIWRRVLAGIEQIDAGEYTECDGREGLRKLANEVKDRGRKLLSRTSKK